MSDFAQTPQVQPTPQPLSQSPILTGVKAMLNTSTDQVTQTQPAAPQIEQANDESLVPLASAVPLAVQVSDDLNPTYPVGGAAKEVRDQGVTLEKPQLEQAAGVQYVEYEKTPELPPEVESYIKQVEDHQDQLPQEVVIAQTDATIQPTTYLAKPVIVLPITAEDEQLGKGKGPHDSISWLLEWSHKIIKIFSGKVIYRQE